jgi:phenol 2-monooxygenase (NADPH)
VEIVDRKAADLTPISSVYTDDVAVDGKKGGDAYQTYGVSPTGGVAAVRPDGYVGYIGSLKDVLDGHLDGYFSAFMLTSL